MTQPLVSIIIPVFNGAEYIKAAIESALDQTYPNVEIIVVNDGSNDDGATDTICRSYGNKIKYLPKSNGGVSSALNYGIENMHGEYFSWLSHDDLYECDKITESIKILSQAGCQEKTIAICGTQYIDSEGKPLSIIAHSMPKEVTGLELFKICFLRKKSLNGSALLIHKSAFKECGLFSDLRFAQDMELWGRMMIAGYSFVSTPYKGSKIRIHYQQATNRLRDVYFEERPKFLKLLFDFTNEVSEHKASYRKILLKACYSTHPRPNSLINEIESTIKINLFEKAYYTMWGISTQLLKNIYHKYKAKK